MNLIDLIIKNKTKCLFISPHLDDAVLSCGALLGKLVNKTDITVINVFTKSHKGPYTLSARKFLKDSGGYSDAAVLSEERFKEDRHALSKLNLKVIDLGLMDALFRKKIKHNFFGRIIPELSHIYPTYKWHVIKKISSEDSALTKLKNIIKKFINGKNVVVFAPYAIGNHVDHLIARNVCEELFDNLILYSDFPYNIHTDNYGVCKNAQRKVELEVNLDEKSKLIKLYKTQFQGLFPNGKVPYHKEVYFISKKLWKQ